MEIFMEPYLSLQSIPMFSIKLVLIKRFCPFDYGGFETSPKNVMVTVKIVCAVRGSLGAFVVLLNKIRFASVHSDI